MAWEAPLWGQLYFFLLVFIPSLISIFLLFTFYLCYYVDFWFSLSEVLILYLCLSICSRICVRLSGLWLCFVVMICGVFRIILIQFTKLNYFDLQVQYIYIYLLLCCCHWNIYCFLIMSRLIFTNFSQTIPSVVHQKFWLKRKPI